ncbi:unnamed protein product [Mesocestoides corti]|uniref:Uncharacterized protein n=1 Tax=Mesocestoides corti TaxID=53468 RepID=A0A0R3UNJ3_MESCO|nr:unnamed protein product [Mesocestoides corti]
MENVATAKFNDAVVPSGPNSDLVLKQLSLLSVWMSRLIAERVAISPSATGLLLLHSRLCLQAPIEVHDDSAFNSNQLRLLILAQLACSLDYWPYLLRLLQLTLTDPTKDVNFGVECARLANEPIGACGGGAFVCSPPPIEAFLARLLARADALSNRLYRRCFATASLFCLNHLPLCDKLHTDYLGAITSLCVQAGCGATCVI